MTIHRCPSTSSTLDTALLLPASKHVICIFILPQAPNTTLLSWELLTLGTVGSLVALAWRRPSLGPDVHIGQNHGTQILPPAFSKNKVRVRYACVLFTCVNLSGARLACSRMLSTGLPPTNGLGLVNNQVGKDPQYAHLA